MKRIQHGIWPTLIVAGALACAGDQSLAPHVPGSLQGAPSATSGCYDVVADFSGAPSGPWSFSGVLTGDLEGTLTVNFDPGSIGLSGATVHNSGTADWSITGGVVPAPLAFETTFDNMNLVVDRPGSPALVFENIGRHRASSGVARANLTYKGTFAVVPALQANHHYQGVLCP